MVVSVEREIIGVAESAARVEPGVGGVVGSVFMVKKSAQQVRIVFSQARKGFHRLGKIAETVCRES